MFTVEYDYIKWNEVETFTEEFNTYEEAKAFFDDRCENADTCYEDNIKLREEGKIIAEFHVPEEEEDDD